MTFKLDIVVVVLWQRQPSISSGVGNLGVTGVQSPVIAGV